MKGSDGRYILEKKIRAEISRRNGARNAGSDSRDTQQQPSKKIKISNLSEEVTMEDLENLFHHITETFTLESLQEGAAQIDFPEISHADEAIKLYNNTEFMGNIIQIEKDNPEIVVRERGERRERRDGGDRAEGGNKGERGDRGREWRGDRRSRSRERRSRSRDRHPRERERERDDRRRFDYDDRSRRGGGRDRSRDRGNGYPPSNRRERMEPK